MDAITRTAVFIVGIGAKAGLYTEYLGDLKKRLPQTKLVVLEWWDKDDFGMSELESSIGDSEVMLIGHSAGSVIALQALSRWPALIKKVIMIDSHFLHPRGALPKLTHMVDMMVNNDKAAIRDRVKQAYAPILKNDLIVNHALTFAIEWVNDHFNQACHQFKKMPSHSGLYVGFTSSAYQILTADDQKKLMALWKKFNVDVKFIPIYHFGLIETKQAAMINQMIIDWLRQE